MPVSAPDVSAVASVRKTASFRYIDASGDKISHSMVVPNAATLAEIQALGVAVGAMSNANLYSIHVDEEWNAVPATAPALQAGRSESVYDHAVVQFKTPAGDSQRVYTPAPVEAIFTPFTDTIDPTDGLMVATIAAAQALLPGYLPVGVRYNEKREINTQSAI